MNFLMGDNGILTKTNKAVDDTKMANANEQVQMLLSEFQIQSENSKENLKDFLIRKKSEGVIQDVYNNGNVSAIIIIDGYSIIIDKTNLNIMKTTKPVVREGLKVGDYIKFEPDAAEAYSKDNFKYANTGSMSNTNDITQENLTWQILKIIFNEKI